MSINNNIIKKRQELPQICTFTGNLETYKITDTLQDSLYGKVYQGYGEESGKLVAIKVLSKNDIITKEMNRLLPETPLAEVFFANEMANHEYLATIRDVFETEDSHCIVSDLADGEDLLELLKKNRYGLSESQTKICMKQAAIALSKCHERGFALQDFSLENCLLYSVSENKDLNDENQSENIEMEDDDEFIGGEILNNNDIKDTKRKFQIKVCDPGQAVRFGRYSPEIEMPVPYLGCVGKRFRPPEIFAGKPYIASKVDSWCLGWSTFYLLFGIELFESVHNIDNDIRWQWYSMGYRDYLYSYLGIKEKLSMDARSFIESLVHPDPIHRMSIKEALNHPFLRDVNENENLILEDWGRPLYYEFKNSLKTEKSKEYMIPFIPKVYKTKYLKLYCTRDKPSGYFPINYKSNSNHINNNSQMRGINNSKLINIQNQKSIVNNTIPVTARSINNNNASNGQNSIGLTSIFQKRRVGKVSGNSTSSLSGRGVMNNNNNSQQQRISINQNQVGGVIDVGFNPKLLYYQGQYQQRSCYQNYYGNGYNAHCSGYTSGMGAFHPQYYAVIPPLTVNDTTRTEGTQKVSATAGKEQVRKREAEDKKSTNETVGSKLITQSSLSSNRKLTAAVTKVASTTNIESNTCTVTTNSTATTSPSIATPNVANINSSAVSSNNSILKSSTSLTAASTATGLNSGLANGVVGGAMGIGTGANSIMMYQTYGGLPTVGRRGGYSLSYVPAPKVGISANIQQLNFGGGITSGAKIVGTTNSSNTSTSGFVQNVKNFSYVPPPLTSRYNHNNTGIGGEGHQYMYQSHQQTKNVSKTTGGASTRIGFGSLSYVPPLMRK
ncbi:kinase domain-containing [Cryptosporidium sp. chipmunk genotype I]|uniref:kinase domain-containing n=1 Tax=Cryptosporidium sp. chipmunk genotype I TaxID=1280935 RepID=UPI00351A4A77|nr:kinase domain-containing [Cryptosporidium sp. chipmunk genotype I]